MGPGLERRQLIYYNCKGSGHYSHDYTNPIRIYCTYYEYFDHEMVGCLTLISQMCEKGGTIAYTNSKCPNDEI